MMNTQRMTGEKDTMLESGMVVMEVIVEEVITMVAAMMEVEKGNEEKEIGCSNQNDDESNKKLEAM